MRRVSSLKQIFEYTEITGKRKAISHEPKWSGSIDQDTLQFNEDSMLQTEYKDLKLGLDTIPNDGALDDRPYEDLLTAYGEVK